MNDPIRTLQRDLQLSRGLIIGLTTASALLALMAFRQAKRTTFTEIDVERINIVEKDGTRRLVIANSERIAPVTFYGKEYPDSRRAGANARAGMIFFNDEGTEDGGMGWTGRRLPDGSFRAFGGLTFDQYNQDEAIGLAYFDDNGKRWTGLVVFDQPEGSLQPYFDSLEVFRSIADSAERARRTEAYRGARREQGELRSQRLFVGKDVSKASVVTLADLKGRPRLRLSVDSLGVARLEFLDEYGKVTKRLSGAR